jgi:hypothetical protein
LDKTSDTKWIATALTKGTVLISTNGLYSWKRAPHVCKTGWALACRVAQRVITGSFHKFSCNASSYWGELLGIVAAHKLILHTAQYYHLSLVSGRIYCDSQSALRRGSTKQRRVQPGTQKANLFHTLGYIHQLIPNATLTYKWVKRHQDNKTAWSRLKLPAQLNITCNRLAEEAVTRAH